MSKEMAFIVFCLESYKAYHKFNGRAVLQLFEQYGVFDYIRDFFDVTHTIFAAIPTR